jgi:hypothetical protein
VNVYNWAQFMA